MTRPRTVASGLAVMHGKPLIGISDLAKLSKLSSRFFLRLCTRSGQRRLRPGKQAARRAYKHNPRPLGRVRAENRFRSAHPALT